MKIITISASEAYLLLKIIADTLNLTAKYMGVTWDRRSHSGVCHIYLNIQNQRDF